MCVQLPRSVNIRARKSDDGGDGSATGPSAATSDTDLVSTDPTSVDSSTPFTSASSTSSPDSTSNFSTSSNSSSSSTISIFSSSSSASNSGSLSSSLILSSTSSLPNSSPISPPPSVPTDTTFQPDVSPITSTLAVITTVTAPSSSSGPIIPTTLSNAQTIAGSYRSGVIAGSAIGAVVLLLAALTFVFYRRYSARKHLGFVEAVLSSRHEAHSRSRLLDGEDLDAGVTRSRDQSLRTPWETSAHDGSVSMKSFSDSSPRLMRVRGSETGSIFHEGVWPPPGEQLVDPIKAHASSVDLSSIVDNIMGPSDSPPPSHYNPNLVYGQRNAQASSSTVGYAHSRESSFGSRPIHAREDSQVGLMSDIMTSAARKPRSPLSTSPVEYSFSSPPNDPPPPPPYPPPQAGGHHPGHAQNRSSGSPPGLPTGARMPTYPNAISGSTYSSDVIGLAR